MTKFGVSLRVMMAAGLSLALLGCSADEKPADPAGPISSAAPSPSPTPSLVPAQKLSPTAAFKSACTDRITAKMVDPTAVDISYVPLSGLEGFKATVTLQKQGNGGTMTLYFTCHRNDDGGVMTKLIAD